MGRMGAEDPSKVPPFAPLTRTRGFDERFGDPGGPDSGEATSSAAIAHLLGVPAPWLRGGDEQRRS